MKIFTNIKAIAILVVFLSLSACGTDNDECDIDTLKQQNEISEGCKDAINDLLSSPTNNLTTKIISLGKATNGSSQPLLIIAGSDFSTLSQSDITLTAIYNNSTENVVPNSDYTLTNLSDANISISTSVAIDYSGSMSDGDIDDAVSVFSDILSAFSDMAGPAFESEIRLFSSNVTLKNNFTSSKTTLLNSILRDNDYNRTSTALFDAIGEGLTALSSRSGDINILFVATDGLENSSSSYLTKQELYTLAQNNDIPVIMLGALFSDLSFMKEMADETGGYFVYNKTLLAIKQNIQDLLDSMSNARVITVTGADSSALTFKVTINNKTTMFSF